jgi:hypothetical protein
MRPWESLSRRPGQLPATRGAGGCDRGEASCTARQRPGSSAQGKVGEFRNPCGSRVRRSAQRLGFVRLRGSSSFPTTPPHRLEARRQWEFLTHFRRPDHWDRKPAPGGNVPLTIVRQALVRWVHATVGIPVAPAGSATREAGRGRGGDRGEASCTARQRPGSSAQDKVVQFRNPAGLGFVRSAQALGFVGFVRSAQRLKFVRLRGDLSSPTTLPRSAGGSTGDGNYNRFPPL